MLAGLDRNFIYLDYPPPIAEGRFNASYVKSKGCYRIPHTLEACKEVYEVYPHPKLLGHIHQLEERQKEHLSIKLLEDIEGDPRLRPYQRVDVAFLKTLPHAGIFNQQRTGKTPTTLVLMKEMGFQNIGIVAPASTLVQWQREVEKWLNRKAIILSGMTARKREKLIESYRKSHEEGKAQIFLISFESLVIELEKLLLPLDALIVDEIHRIRGRGTKQAKAVNKLGSIAKHRYALTGTPAVRRADDFWSILHFLYPEKFPSYHQFCERYIEMEWNPFAMKWLPNGRVCRPKEMEEILSMISIQRKRKDVMKWLPKNDRKVVVVKPSSKQKKVYEEVRDTFEYVENNEVKIDAPTVLAKLIRLRQISVDPNLVGVDAKSGKKEWLMEWLKDNEKEPTLVFSTFSKFLSNLYSELTQKRYKVGIVTGNTSPGKRQSIVDDFQQGKIDILLLNIKAAGVGLTLDRATTSIFVDKEFNPSDNEQAEDRLIPTTPDRVQPTQIISLVTEGTYDEAIEVILKNKLDIIQIINKAGLSALERLIQDGNPVTPVA